MRTFNNRKEKFYFKSGYHLEVTEATLYGEKTSWNGFVFNPDGHCVASMRKVTEKSINKTLGCLHRQELKFLSKNSRIKRAWFWTSISLFCLGVLVFVPHILYITEWLRFGTTTIIFYAGEDQLGAGLIIAVILWWGAWMIKIGLDNVFQ